MARPSGQIKREFFAGLAMLDDFASSDDESSQQSGKGVSKIMTTTTAPSMPVPAQILGKRKPTPSLASPCAPVPSLLPSSSSAPEPQSKATQDPDTDAVQSHKPTQKLRRVRSANEPVRKARLKRKDDPQILPPSQQIFQDLVFFFVPNDAVNSVRKRRIKLATAFGARRVADWSSEVSHVIIESEHQSG